MSRKADEVDQKIARRMLAARKAARMSQQVAGEHIGVTFQQLQKYENGSNRVALGRLYGLAKAYKVPMSFFFEGLEPTGDKDPLAQINAMLLEYHHLEKIKLLSKEQWNAVTHIIVAFAEANAKAKT